MSKLHKYEDALADLQALVNWVGPDFVYQTPALEDVESRTPWCRYAYAGAPSCGLGRVFADRWAVPILTLQELDRQGSPVTILGRAGHRMTERARSLLFDFQAAQDRGVKYGDALRRAISDTAAKCVLDDTKAAYLIEPDEEN